MEQAKRFNKGKLRWSLVSFSALELLVKVLMFGAEKYGAHNWKKGLPQDELLDSLMRHVVALNNGEEFDKESGHHHIGHVMCNAMFYAHYYNEGYWDKVISENVIEKST
jgi:hypothetical protein